MKNNYINNLLSEEEKSHIFSASRKAKQKDILDSNTRKNLYLAAKQKKWFINNISNFFNSITSYALYFSKDNPSISYSIIVKIFDYVKSKEKSKDSDIFYQIGNIYSDFFHKSEGLKITFTEYDDINQRNMYEHLSNYFYNGKAQKSYLSNFHMFDFYKIMF